MICEQERDSVKTIKGETVCSMHVSETEWDDADVVVPTREEVGYVKKEEINECEKCGEEILNMEQLHTVANKYRMIKNYHVKLSSWGLSLGVRIPKEMIQKYKLKNNDKLVLIAEKDGIKVVPA